MKTGFFLHRIGRLAWVAFIAVAVVPAEPAAGLLPSLRIEKDLSLITLPHKEAAVVFPGTQGSAPSDALVLFDGRDLSAFNDEGGGAPK